MKRILWLVPCLGLLVFACLGPGRETPPPTSGEVTTRLQAPPMQRTIQLQTWQWGERFFPSDTESAYAVIVTDPEFPGKFMAYGFDVTRGSAPFTVVGSVEYRQRFEDQMRREMSSISRGQMGVIAVEMTKRAVLVPDCADGGTGTHWESPPGGGGSGSGDPPVDQPYIERYAYSLALGRNEAILEGSAVPTDVFVKLEAPTTQP